MPGSLAADHQMLRAKLTSAKLGELLPISQRWGYMKRSEFLAVAGGALVQAAGIRRLFADTKSRTTVLSNEHVTQIDEVLPDAKDLWITPAELEKVNGFELKPQGACLNDICIPIRKEGAALVRKSGGQTWFNLTGFARKLKQSYISDDSTRVWSFGEIPAVRGGFLNSRVAPDFAMADRKGNMVHLSDFRGKKVLLVTWASW